MSRLTRFKQIVTDNFARLNLDRAPTLAPHVELGARGEQLAIETLVARRYQIVASNVRLPTGRSRRNQIIHNEIDVIAYDEDDVLCFVEVKTRKSDWFAAPEANVDLRKQRQITRAARVYRRLLDLRDAPFRYDVVTVILPDDETVAQRVEILKNFWTEDKFRKRRWTYST